jgi:hypothetical protein
MATNLNPGAVLADEGTSPVPTGDENKGVTGTPPEGSGGASPAPATESQGIRQLREAYENLKKEYEPYQKFGKPEEIETRISGYTKAEGAVIEIGTQLGYTEDEIRQAFQNDPTGTYDFLRTKMAEGGQNQSPEVQQLRKELADIKKSLDPLKQSQEQQRMDQARVRFDEAVDAAIKSVFKDETLSEDEKSYIWDDALSMLRLDKDAVNRLVNEGKTSDVVRFVTQARERADKIYLARSGRERKSGSGEQRETQGQAASKLSIDDIIMGKFPKDHPMAKYSE